MRTVILVTALLVVAGCGPNESKPLPQTKQDVDQCMRREIFKECMGVVPPGPKTANFNDWAEVVDECESAARDQSIRLQTHIKPECRMD